MPDITLAELRERLIAERGETFAPSTIHDFYHVQKKTAHASEQAREDVAARREASRKAVDPISNEFHTIPEVLMVRSSHGEKFSNQSFLFHSVRMARN